MNKIINTIKTNKTAQEGLAFAAVVLLVLIAGAVAPV
jgi:hypothetical protein